MSDFSVDSFAGMFDEADQADASLTAGFLLEMIDAFQGFSDYFLDWIGENRKGADRETVAELILQFGLAGMRFFGAKDRLADFIQDYCERDGAQADG